MAIYLGNTLLTGPSGGTGDAVLADDQTFTGINTFTNINGIRIDGITPSAGGFRYLTNSSSSTQLFFGSDPILQGNSSGLIINPNSFDKDFYVRKTGSGFAFQYNNGTDTLSTDAANLEGFAGSETGTWTPVFVNGGTEGTIIATYSKSGQIVVVQVAAEIAASTSTASFRLTTSSLPFGIRNGDIANGTYFTSQFGTPANPSTSGVTSSEFGSTYFLDNSINNTLKGNALRGDINFSLTYETND